MEMTVEQMVKFLQQFDNDYVVKVDMDYMNRSISEEEIDVYHEKKEIVL